LTSRKKVRNKYADRFFNFRLANLDLRLYDPRNRSRGLFKQADGYGRVAEKLFAILHGTGADFDRGRQHGGSDRSSMAVNRMHKKWG
jgi:hypothetical protein